MFGEKFLSSTDKYHSCFDSNGYGVSDSDYSKMKDAVKEQVNLYGANQIERNSTLQELANYYNRDIDSFLRDVKYL